MALFKRNYNKPGPGVPKNAPRKRGISRFFEVLARDFSNLIKLNLLFQLCLLPFEVLVWLALFSMELGASPLLFLLGALVFSIPVGPALTAVMHAISKMLRDEPGFVWHDFKKQFRENFKGTVLVGMLYAMVIAAQIMLFYMYGMGLLEGNFAYMVILVVSAMLFWMTSGYFFLQAGYVQLGVGGLLKNSLLLALGNAPRSLGAAFVTVLFLVLQLLMPVPSLLVTVVFGYTVPMLIGLMLIWPPVDKTFKIEETLKAREEQRLKEAGAVAATGVAPKSKGDQTSQK